MEDDEEDLNVSFNELSIEDVNVDVPEDTSSITLQRSWSIEKHALSLSKIADEPKVKRKKGIECKARQDHLQHALKETFVESPDRSTPQDVLMDCLQVDSKNLATRAVRGAFQTALFDKHRCVYKNIRKSISFSDYNTSQSDETIKNVSNDSVISRLKDELAEHKIKAKNIMDRIMSVVAEQTYDKTFLKSLLLLYNKEMEQVSVISEQIDMEFEKELRNLSEKKGTSPSSSDVAILAQEWDNLSRIVDTGIRSGETLPSMDNITGEIFKRLQVDFFKYCPFLTCIVTTLLGSENESNKKQKGTVHALGLLMSLRSQKCENDITLFFTMMLISYGAGHRMINMLNKIGLAVHWTTLMNFLDKQLLLGEKNVQSKTPSNTPLILLMDNVNIYKGNQRHHRLFKAIGSIMWSLTCQGLLIPNTDGIEDLFLCPETSIHSQHNVTEFTWTI